MLKLPKSEATRVVAPGGEAKNATQIPARERSAADNRLGQMLHGVRKAVFSTVVFGTAYFMNDITIPDTAPETGVPIAHRDASEMPPLSTISAALSTLAHSLPQPTMKTANAALQRLDAPVAEDVDLIEENHFYDAQGKLILEQIIFYEWSPPDGRFNVRDWRLMKTPEQRPTKNWKTGEYCTTWQDGDVLRSVSATSFRETWTQYDPELAEREHLPKERRRFLIKIEPTVPPKPAPVRVIEQP